MIDPSKIPTPDEVIPPMRPFLLALALLAAPLVADEITDALPADTLAYAQLTDLQNLPDRLEHLPIWSEGGWQAETVERVQEMLFGSLAEEMAIERDRAVEFLRTCRSIHAALLAFDIQDEESIEAIIVLELGDATPALGLIGRELAELFSRAEKHGPHTVWNLSEKRGPVFKVGLANERLALGIGEGVLERFLDALAGDATDRLSDVASFKAMAADFGRSPIWGYANPQPFISRVKEGLDFKDRAEFDKIDGVFVLGDFTAVGFASNYDFAPDQIATRLRVVHEAENPFLEVCRSRNPGGAGALRYVPADSGFAATTSIESGKETWTKVKQFAIHAERTIADDDDFARELDQIKGRINVDLDKAFAMVEGSIAVFIPRVDGYLEDDYFTFLFQVGDADDARKLFGDMKSSDVFKEYAESGRIKSETYRGAHLEWVEAEYENLGYAIHENNVLVSGHVDALRAALDARSGQVESMVARYGDVMEKFPAGHEKTLVLDAPSFLGIERETGLAAYRIRRDWPVLVGTVETERSTEFQANVSLYGLLSVLGLGAYLQEEMRPVGAACRERLNVIGQAAIKYREKNGRFPPSLAALAEAQGLDGPLHCPQADDGQVEGDYVYLEWPAKADDDMPWFAVMAYCPRGEHGRTLLSYEGPDTPPYATQVAEDRFGRYLARTRKWLAESAEDE